MYIVAHSNNTQLLEVNKDVADRLFHHISYMSNSRVTMLLNVSLNPLGCPVRLIVSPNHDAHSSMPARLWSQRTQSTCDQPRFSYSTRSPRDSHSQSSGAPADSGILASLTRIIYGKIHSALCMLPSPGVQFSRISVHGGADFPCKQVAHSPLSLALFYSSLSSLSSFP